MLVLAWAKPRWRTLIESITSAADDSNMLAQLGLHHKGSLDENPSSLTPRETEVLAFVVQGLRNREIASRLYISEVTVKTHLRHVYEQKLGVRVENRSGSRRDRTAGRLGDNGHYRWLVGCELSRCDLEIFPDSKSIRLRRSGENRFESGHYARIELGPNSLREA